jgi:hypothetical protein
LQVAALKERPKLVWVEKGLTILPSTLRCVRRHVPGVILLSFHPDDIRRWRSVSLQYRLAISSYDFHVTTRRCNVQDLNGMGARSVILTKFGFDPRTHRPLSPSDVDRRRLGGRVGFVGLYEPIRARALGMLARNGLPVRVWGYGHWERVNACDNLIVERRPLWGEDYAKAVASFEINIGFLSTYNRDEHTTRTFEIPACGGFLLAQRTQEHMELYQEGVEAEFFGDEDELLDKCSFYLRHPAVRERIAAAGQRRCWESGYDYRSRLMHILEEASRGLKLSL